MNIETFKVPAYLYLTCIPYIDLTNKVEASHRSAAVNNTRSESATTWIVQHNTGAREVVRGVVPKVNQTFEASSIRLGATYSAFNPVSSGRSPRCQNRRGVRHIVFGSESTRACRDLKHDKIPGWAYKTRPRGVTVHRHGIKKLRSRYCDTRFIPPRRFSLGFFFYFIVYRSDRAWRARSPARKIRAIGRSWNDGVGGVTHCVIELDRDCSTREVGPPVRISFLWMFNRSCCWRVYIFLATIDVFVLPYNASGLILYRLV